MIGIGPSTKSPASDFAGTWLGLATRFGQDDIVDITATYALDGYFAFMTQDAALLRRADRAGIKAMQSMRKELTENNGTSTTGVPIALTILFLAEVSQLAVTNMRVF